MTKQHESMKSRKSPRNAHKYRPRYIVHYYELNANYRRYFRKEEIQQYIMTTAEEMDKFHRKCFFHFFLSISRSQIKGFNTTCFLPSQRLLYTATSVASICRPGSLFFVFSLLLWKSDVKVTFVNGALRDLQSKNVCPYLPNENEMKFTKTRRRA